MRGSKEEEPEKSKRGEWRLNLEEMRKDAEKEKKTRGETIHPKHRSLL